MIKKTEDLSVTESLSVLESLLDILALVVLKEGHENVAVVLWDALSMVERARIEVAKWEMQR